MLISPFLAIAAYEREYGIPHNYINCSMYVLHLLIYWHIHLCQATSVSAAHGSHGAWQRFERGELPLFSFYEAFGHELSNTVDGNVWYKSYCKRKGIGKALHFLPPPRTKSICNIECPKLPETLHVDGREVGSICSARQWWSGSCVHANGINSFLDAWWRAAEPLMNTS